MMRLTIRGAKPEPQRSSECFEVFRESGARRSRGYAATHNRAYGVFPQRLSSTLRGRLEKASEWFPPRDSKIQQLQLRCNVFRVRPCLSSTVKYCEVR